MKKLYHRLSQLLVMCFIVTSMTGAVFAADDHFTVRLTPSSESVIKGDSFTIDVDLEGDSYACADIKLQYDADRVVYESAEGLNNLEVSDSTPAGTLHITCYGDVQTGGSTVSTLTFAAKNTGTAAFDVTEAKAATSNVVSLTNAEVSNTSVLIKNADVPDTNPDSGETFGSVEITSGEHGSVSASPEQAKAGDTVTLTTKPEEGYAVDEITVVDANGNAIDVTDNGDGSYSFTMPTGNVNVNAGFVPIIDIDAGTNGTATVDNNSPKTGDKVTLTVKPNDGYEVDTVTVTDKDGKAIEVTANEDGTFSFTKPEGNVSVKITYKNAPSDPDENCPSRKYSDLDTSLWYHEAVDFVLNSKYFQGTSDTTFEPDSTMTRAMFVTVLSRLEGIDGAQYSGSDFTDVETGQWYTAAIQWASQNGIVLGVGEQKFDPEGEVTREQMAAIMYRYAQYKKIDTTKADASKFGSFSDKDSVSDWAVEAMTWATGIGIINGTDTGIEPQANSTRAQVAQIVKNYTEKVS